MAHAATAGASAFILVAATLWSSSAHAQERVPAWGEPSTTPSAAAEAAETAVEEEDTAEEPPVGEPPQEAVDDEATRHRAIRNCHTCNHGLLRFDVAVPLIVPFVEVTMIPDDGSEAVVDYTSQLTFAASLELELRAGPITAHIAGIGLSLGSHRLADRANADIGEIGLLAVLGRGHLKWNAPTIALGADGSGPRLALWPLAGARVLWIIGQVDRTLRDYEEDLLQIDPYLGLETILDFTGPWSLKLGLSAGGFTVGNDISLIGELNAEHRFTHWFTMSFGYFVYYAADSDTGRSLFKDFEFLMHGPALSLHVTLQ